MTAKDPRTDPQQHPQEKLSAAWLRSDRETAAIPKGANSCQPRAASDEDLLTRLRQLERDHQQLQESNARLRAENEQLQALNGRMSAAEESSERKLRDKESFLRRTLDSLFTFAAVCTPDGRLIEVNRPALEVAGLRADQVLGKPFDQSYWFAHDRLVQERIREALRGAAAGSRSRFDVEVQIGAEQRLMIDFQLVPMYDDQGTITHLIPSAIDISDRKQFENRLKLERLRADAANRSKTEFLANMSHEIRTPMTAILGYAELLNEQLTKIEDRRLVDTIRDNGRYLLDIINDILDLSKIESRKLDIQPAQVLLPRFVHELYSLMKLRAEEKDLSFSCSAPTPIPQTIHTDPVRLRQILINLIGNAIKFTEAGMVRLDVSFDPATAALKFDVCDTGVGIDKPYHQSIFQPFSQVDASHTRAVGGTGLGLPISHRLAESLGGRIHLHSEPNVGSTFSLILKLHRQDHGALIRCSFADQRPNSPFRAPRCEPQRLDCRVIVIDDRREIRFLAQRFIEAAGGSVVTAEDGATALNCIRRAEQSGQPFDVVLTDIQMPQMDGYELTRRLRASGFRQPIIALTAHAMKKDFEKCFDVGCDAFSSKPLEKNEFIRLLYRYTSELSQQQIEAARQQ